MTLELQGFEDALVERIAAASQTDPPEFRFGAVSIRWIPLVPGRHLFVQDMPEVEDIAETIEEDTPYPYRPNVEPTIGIFTQTGIGVEPSASYGGRLEWTLRIALRMGTVNEDCKSALEELVEFVSRKAKGRLGAFLVKGIQITQRPQVFRITETDQVFAEAQLRFLAVRATP